MTSMKFMKRAYLASAAATALTLAMSATAIAQDADTEVEVIEDEIVATGIRQSIANSLKLKRESSSIVEAISSEDIGKLPDVSIADSLARLPGVTAQRVRGRAQSISIRGLGPDFSISLLNGREQVSAGNNRGIEFDQYPSELIASGLVYKTPDARLAATGIAGAVDLRTVRPLDFSERKINLSGKYVINDNGALNPDFSDDGYRLFGSYINQFADGRIGLAIGITDQSNPTQFTSRELKTAEGQTERLASGITIPRDNPRTGVVSRSFDRTSVTGTLQFEPTERFQATVDAYYSDFEDAGIFRGVETPIASWSGTNATNVTGTDGFADSVTYSPTTPIIRTDTEGNTAELFSFGINTSFAVTENLKLIGDYSHSTLDRADRDYESYAGTGAGALNSGNPALLDSLTFTLPDEGNYSIAATRDYTDPNVMLLTDPGGWGQVGFIKEPQIDDELNQLRLEAEYELNKSFIEGVTVGALLTDRVKSFNSNENFIDPGAAFTNREARIPTNSIVGVTDDAGTGIPLIAYDPSSFLTDGTYALRAANDVAWSVDESIDTFYAMANINFEGSIPVRGNFGVRYEDVTQASTGTLNGLVAGDTSIQTVTDSYDYWLPSINLSAEVMENTFLRGGFAKTVSRPRLDQLAANQGASINNNVCVDDTTNPDGLPDTYIAGGFNPPNAVCLTIGGGNPFLRPYRSTSYDVSFEKYFSESGAISIAAFYKDLSDYVQDGATTFTDSAIAGRFLGAGFVSANPTAATYNVGGTANLEEGSIKGIEVAIRLPLGDLIGALEGFGINANYTYADSNIELPGDIQVTIPGYSKDTAAGEIYYENDGFRARINGRYRSTFLSEVQLFDGGLAGAQALDEFLLDAQIGYEWDSGPLEGFGINLEAYNITDEPFRTEQQYNGGNGDTFVSRYEQYGTTYNITVSKKF